MSDDRFALAESRWPPIATTLTVLALIVYLPGRYRVAPPIVPIALTLAMVGTMFASMYGRDKPYWMRVERVAIFVFAAVAAILVYVMLGRLLDAIIMHTEAIHPTTLLSSAVALWLVNVLLAALVYWQMDQGGPEGRAAKTGYPDFAFPQAGAEGMVPPEWRPVFVDYLALGVTTAVAFSPTDVLPFTARAKAVMILQAVTSLITVVVIAARAIGILQ